jgi:excinuclease UvrABC ATPase subunit
MKKQILCYPFEETNIMQLTENKKILNVLEMSVNKSYNYFQPNLKIIVFISMRIINRVKLWSFL